jgi:hypothetical protein
MTLSLASVTPDEALHSDLVPPAGLKFNDKGLSPRRKELAQFCAWRKFVESERDILTKGRADADAHADRLTREVVKSEADETAVVDNVINRIREGLKWSIAPRQQPAIDRSSELAVTRSIVSRLDAEIADKDRLIETLGRRITAASVRAMHEYAESVRGAYADAIEQVRELAAQLLALDRMSGRHLDRVVFDVPHFSGRYDFLPVRVEEGHINAARQVWAKLMADWRLNPHAEPKLDEFPKHDPNAAETLIYHERSPSERLIIDSEFSGASIGSNTTTTH